MHRPAGYDVRATRAVTAAVPTGAVRPRARLAERTNTRRAGASRIGARCSAVRAVLLRRPPTSQVALRPFGLVRTAQILIGPSLRSGLTLSGWARVFDRRRLSDRRLGVFRHLHALFVRESVSDSVRYFLGRRRSTSQRIVTSAAMQQWATSSSGCSWSTITAGPSSAA
jgi:hypothetical protein